MGPNQHIGEEFEECGRGWRRNAISVSDLTLFDKATAEPAKAGQRLGSSKALDAALSGKGSLLDAIRQLDQSAAPFRIVAFNKSESTN